MSVRVSAAVWSLSKQKGTGLIVMLALADMARDDGLAWPGVPHIAAKARISKRQAHRVLRELRETNELQLAQRGGGATPNMYRINLALLYSYESRDFSSGFEDDELGGDVDDTPDNLSPLSSGAKGVTSGDLSVPSDVTRNVETSEQQTPSTADAAASDGHLPGLEPPPSPTQPQSASVPNDPFVEEVWSVYLALFGGQLAKKELTDPRRTTIQRGLRAVNNDVEVAKRAVHGFKSYREKGLGKSKDIGLSNIFATGPHDRSNLTEKIEFWASQAEDNATLPASVPSVMRARVLELAVEVLTIERQPDNSGVRERGELAQRILRERFGLKVTSDGKGKLVGWQNVPKDGPA
jgi:hypothetical protein